MATVEKITDRVCWFIRGDKASIPATLLRTKNDSPFNHRLAVVLPSTIGRYEAFIKRPMGVDDWSLGVYDTVQDAKDAILLALTIERLEQANAA